MPENSFKSKKNLLKKLKSINMTNEKDILNMKVSELKKINQNDNIPKLTLKDIETIWSMQEAIETKGLWDFFIDMMPGIRHLYIGL